MAKNSHTLEVAPGVFITGTVRSVTGTMGRKHVEVTTADKKKHLFLPAQILSRTPAAQIIENGESKNGEAPDEPAPPPSS
jgi:hypothetical protein